MTTVEEWIQHYYVTHTVADAEHQDGCRVVPPKEQFIQAIQTDAFQAGRQHGLREASDIIKRQFKELLNHNPLPCSKTPES